MKRILIIDNEDQSDEILDLKSIAHKKGLKLEFDQFNVGHPTVSDVLTDNVIDIKKVKDVFLNKYTKRYHIICFDYELGPEGINGVDILSILRPLPIVQKSQFIFYSSKLRQIIKRLLDEYRENEKNFNNVLKKLVALISSRIEGFIDRKDFQNKLLEVVFHHEETLEDILEEKLAEYPNYKTEYFDGLQIYSLEHLLSTNDGKAQKFKREIMEHLVAYLIKLHDDE